MKAVHVSTFSGIGGFDLAAETVGWENIAHCEINPFGQRVLKHYWPDALSFSDITKIGNEEAQQIRKRAGTTPIVFSGGFPCQPFSAAGKRQGSDDDRHLWPEVVRVVGLIQPRVCVFENVFGLTSILEQACYTAMEREVVRLFSEDNDSQDVVETIERIHQRTLGIIIADLEEAGYTLPCTQSGEPIILCVPAAGVGAPHRRDRVWIVAKNTKRDGFVQRKPKQEGTEVWEQRNSRPRSVDGVCGEKMAAASANSNSINGRYICGQSPSFGGIEKAHTAASYTNGNGPTPNPNNPRTDNPLRGDGDGKAGKRGGQQELESGQACGDVADPQGRGCRLCASPNFRAPTGEEHTPSYSAEICAQQLSAAATGTRLERSAGPSEGRYYTRLTSNSQSSHWQNFPTQPPVCGGDDGFSSELDGIAIQDLLQGSKPREPWIPFGKWRNESIKAYGNAIVPQVAIELFKAINETL